MIEERLAYFAPTDQPDVFQPLSMVASGWGPTQMMGPAITGMLARGALQKAKELELDAVLVRAVYDLHTVARLLPTRVRASVVKRGRRVSLIDVALLQGDREVARASAYFASPAQSGGGRLWLPEAQISAPEPGGSLTQLQQLYFSEATGWTNDAASVRGDARKAVWVEGPELVQGEPISGALLTGYAADVTSATLSWGTSGVAYINIDATTSVTREPAGSGVGLYATFATEHHGLVAGSALIFDREGPLGVATISGIVQPLSVNPQKW